MLPGHRLGCRRRQGGDTERSEAHRAGCQIARHETLLSGAPDGTKEGSLNQAARCGIGHFTVHSLQYS